MAPASVARAAARDQMHDHFGVAGGLENRTAMFQPPPHFQRIRQIAVVAQRDFALVAVDDHRLRVHHGVVARRGIARVADCQRAGKLRKYLRRENFLHQAETLVEVQLRAIA